MNKAIGILVIGLGLIMIAIGVMGTQSQVLADLKAVNPKLKSATGTSGATTTSGAANAGAATTAGGTGTTA
jgi:hypothetical protein